MENIQESELPVSGNDLIFTSKYGIDKSVGYPIYRILNPTIIILMFTFLEAKEVGKFLKFWDAEVPYSPFFQRPLFLTLGKENKENLQHICQVIEKRNMHKSMCI